MYVNARHNRKKDIIEIVERDSHGNRIFNEVRPDYSFYITHEKGNARSIYGNLVKKIPCKNKRQFDGEIKANAGKTFWESDVNYVYRCLEQHYKHTPTPRLHVTFFDIEVDFDSTRGYAPINDPFSKITAITFYNVWEDLLVTLALKPMGMKIEDAEIIGNKFPNTQVFEDEESLLKAFLLCIQDSDILSGWNSLTFDLPYIIGRINKTIGMSYAKQLCLWNGLPKPKNIVRYGKEIVVPDLIGRIHLDLMDVYIKFTYEERHSYSLNAIAEYELHDSKVAYSGSLDILYNNDFEKFIDYNRKDVNLLYKLEDKLKFIDLLNGLAHDTCTIIPACMGTVSMIDNAIMMAAHEKGMVVNNRKSKGMEEHQSVVGAYVASPKVGVHEMVGIIDVNSLYPSTIRALNMGMDTIEGQLLPTYTNQHIQERFHSVKNMTYAKAWEEEFGSKEYQLVMAKSDLPIEILWENGEKSRASGKDIYNMIFDSRSKYVLSGNGTIFTTSKDGIVPDILANWYKERKALQRKKSEYTDLLYGIEVPEALADKL